MKKYFFLTLLLAVLLLSAGCLCYRSDHYHSNLESALNNIYRLTVNYQYKTGETWTSSSKTGAAIPLGDGYFVGLTHCFQTDTILVDTPWGVFETSVFSKNQTYEIDGHLLTMVGHHEDIMLFKAIVPENFSDAYPFPWCNSDSILVGDRVLLIGWPWMKEKNIREGIVSDVNPESYEQMDTKNLFAFSINAIGGDSGTPVLGYRWGNLCVIGLAQISTQQGVSFALKSNYVLDAIEKIKNS